MSFSEFQYSNRQAFFFTGTSEIWTKEDAVSGLKFQDKVETGRRLTVNIRNPQNVHGSKYVSFQRVRVIDRPSNAVLFIGRITNAQNDHRKQTLTLTCVDYVGDLGDKTVPSANLYGNRRGDIAKDVISGGIEHGRTEGVSGSRDRISDSTKKFTTKYEGRVVKVAGRGPGLVTAVTNTNTLTDSSATGIYAFDASFINRLIRKITFYQGRKKIMWEGRVTAVPTGNQLTITATGVDTTLSGGANYASASHQFVINQTPAHYWEIVGYEGTITKVLTSTMVECSTVGSTSIPNYAGYKDANFFAWGASTAGDGTVEGKKGGVDYVIESAEDGIFQFVAGQSHTSDKSIDWESRVDKSPYLEYIRKSYGQGQASSEGIRETLQKISREEIWTVPQVLSFGGHLASSLGVAKNEWMLGTTEANTGVDLLLKPTRASLPLSTRVYATDGSYFANVVVNNSNTRVENLVANADINQPVVIVASGGSIANKTGATVRIYQDGNTTGDTRKIVGSEFIGNAQDRITLDGNLSASFTTGSNAKISRIYPVTALYFAKAHTAFSDPANQYPTNGTGLLSANFIGAGTGSPAAVGGGPSVGWDPDDPTKNLIQIGNEVRRVTNVDLGSGYIRIDTPFDNVYIYSDNPYIGIGSYEGSPRWESTTELGGAPVNSQPMTENPDLIPNGTFTETSSSGWTGAGLSDVDSSDSNAYLTTDNSTGGTGVLWTTVEGVEEGKVYRLTLEVARDASSNGTLTANDAQERKVWVGSAQPTYASSSWNATSSDILASADMKSSNLVHSNTNRDAWIQYHFEFTAPAGLSNSRIYVSLVVGTASGKKARFDSIQLREKSYDSRLYIGSPRIFNGIKFDLETSTDTYQGMSLEFWGRDKRDGTFGWHTIERYHVDDAQTGDLQYFPAGVTAVFQEDRIATDPNLLALDVDNHLEGSRGIEDFNRSGTIKWWDIGFRDKYLEIDSGSVNAKKYTPDGEWPPNTPWNHWPKDNLRNTEPVLGTKVNTLSTTKHNYSGTGGVPVTGLDDSEYSNLYWVRLSVPSDETLGTDLNVSVHPGFIKNLRILDGRKSSRDEYDVPLYDSTERSLFNAQWDWRVEDPGFFSAIGQVDSTAPATTLNGNINNSVETVPVTSATGFIVGQVIKVEDEEMAITAISSNVLTVTRELGNTDAASHDDDDDVTSFDVWDDYTSDMTSLSKAASMAGFSTTFRGSDKYLYFGADYKFSGIEFNLKTNGTSIGPAAGLIAEYWNGVAWIAVQDLYSYDFSSSGSMRWDMDTIDFVEAQGADYSSGYFESKYQWKKRDLRTSTNTWGNYNYDTTGSGAAKATRNLYIPPNTTEVISNEITQTASVINGSEATGGPTGITQFNVDSSTNLRIGHWINVDDGSSNSNETMLITGISVAGDPAVHTLTVRRGQLGTDWEVASGENHAINSSVKTVEPVGGPVFGDGTGEYPAGVGHITSLDAPHHHLYWMRLRLDGAGAIAISAVIRTIRMFSRPVLKYFERGTEPWNFNLTGTEETTSATTIYGLPNKFEFNDSNGKFIRSPSNPSVNNSDAFIKNTSAADYTYTTSNVLSASRIGLQPALRRGGVGATGESTVVTTLNGAINTSITTVVVEDAKDISVNDYILINLERMMVTAKSDNTLTVIRGVHNDTDNINVVLNANAASGQRVVAMASTTGFAATNSVRIYDNDTPAGEAKVIASIVTNTSITVTTDLANAYTTAASAGILRTEPSNTPEIYFTSVVANHVDEADVLLLPRTTDLHERLHLSAGLFVPGFTPSSTVPYQGQTGSKYLFYQDKVAGVKSYEVYGGDTSTTGNWHGFRITHSSTKTSRNFPLYRYSISEVPANIVTRVTVNGQAPITFTAIDEESETLYGVKKERVIYDRTIQSKTEAESTAESVLISSKPTTTQTVKQATLEFYEFPVYRYNSATTTSVNRDIPRVLRAGDIIQVTIDDGNYKFTNVPFLVQGLEYDDAKSLCKLSCTEGVFPTTTDMFSISDTTYKAAKQARDTAQRNAAASSNAATEQTYGNSGETGAETVKVTTQSDEATELVSTSPPAEQGLNFQKKVNQSVEVSAENSVKEFKTTITLHPNQGAISLAGDTEDIPLNGDNALVSTTTSVLASGLDRIALSRTSPFVARDGGFIPSTNWIGRTIVLNPGATTETTYTITEVRDSATIIVNGGKEWSSLDTTAVIRKISSAIKNPSLSDGGTTTYYDLDQRVLRSRIGNQITGISNTDYPVWGTNFTGFHGTKATDSNGVAIIDLVTDHGVGQLLTHKPVVIATVDPTDLSGAENTSALKSAYVVVQKYTTATDSATVIAQTGHAASTSFGTILVAEAGNNTVSKFASGLKGTPYNIGAEGDTVYRYDQTTKKLLESGTVNKVGTIDGSGALVETDTNPYALTSTGIDGWRGGDIYVVHAQIRKIHLKVYYPALTLAAGAAAAKESVLVDTAGTTFYTSDSVARTVSTATPAGAGIGVHYVIIPKANRKDNLPFDYSDGGSPPTFGHGNDF